MDQSIPIESIFHLQECLSYIFSNNHKRVVLQVKREDLKYTQLIVDYLNSHTNEINQNSVEFYVTQSKTCCLDLLVTQHVSNIDGIIHFGDLCMSEPQVNRSQLDIPVLCVFKNRKVEKNYNKLLSFIENHIESLLTEDINQKICILYDPNCINFAQDIADVDRFNGRVDVAKLVCPNLLWQVCDQHKNYFSTKLDPGKQLEYYLLPNEPSQYDCAIYLGKCPQIQLQLSGLKKFARIPCQNEAITDIVDVARLLRKRIALVDRIRDNDEMKIGVIITNPLPNLNKMMRHLENAAILKKHILYFISMIQTIDDCMIGNFDLCDAFVVINSCSCSTIVESLHFNRPILTATEFQLACGLETIYGGVTWPGRELDTPDLSRGDDLLNKRRASDVSIALIHTKNELLERCNRARLNRWSGLDYDTNIVEKSLNIDEGLKGIASTYTSEPLKPNQNKPQ